ncbi:hypothetical protein LTR72_012267 [Exophiala xenobiotica]|nr:hypothetical protein LTR72_012267 [Exophiala xenobiotica]KAK5432440.1 hypothetical protein LTR18_011061 [Exophiala xenobiotica]
MDNKNLEIKARKRGKNQKEASKKKIKFVDSPCPGCNKDGLKCDGTAPFCIMRQKKDQLEDSAYHPPGTPHPTQNTDVFGSFLEDTVSVSHTVSNPPLETTTRDHIEFLNSTPPFVNPDPITPRRVYTLPSYDIFSVHHNILQDSPSLGLSQNSHVDTLPVLPPSPSPMEAQTPPAGKPANERKSAPSQEHVEMATLEVQSHRPHHGKTADPQHGGQNVASYEERVERVVFDQHTLFQDLMHENRALKKENTRLKSQNEEHLSV